MNAVKDSIALSPYLHQYIAENDKEPSWDGNVYIYDSSKKTKGKLKGRMPVQIKGKQLGSLPTKNKIKYDISIVDLKNYLSDGGVIFFVVYVTDKGEKKIYYIGLTPLKIKTFLNNTDNKKTKRIELKKFPDDINDKTTIFFQCLQNCQMQASFAHAELYTIEELKKNDLIESFTIPFSGVGINDPMEALIRNEVYLYAKIKGSSIPQPVDLVFEKKSIKKIVKRNITIDGKLFYEEYEHEISSTGNIYKFGCSFTIQFKEESRECVIHYNQSTMLRVLAKDLNFFINLIEKGYFEIDGEKVLINSSQLNISSFDINFNRERLTFLQKIVQLLDGFDCHDDLDLKILKDKDYHNLLRLITAFIEKKPIDDINCDVKPVVLIPVGKLKFAVLMQQEKVNGKIKYYMLDFFANEFEFGYKKENEQIERTSQYILLDTNNLLEISNFRPQIVINSFENLEGKQSFNEENNFLLKVLNAYDLSHEKRKDLLEVALKLSQWLKTNARGLDADIKTLNYLQTIKRLRPLNVMENETLWQIIDDEKSEPINKVGAYLLLNEQTIAKHLLKKLIPELQEQFTQYPIYHFFNK